MRRSSFNVDDLIYRFESKKNPTIFYDQRCLTKDRLRRFQQHYNDSMVSLTSDSEYYQSDQDQQDCNEDRRRRINREIYFSSDDDHDIRNTEKVVFGLARIGRCLEILQSVSLPRMSLTAIGICFLISIFISPRTCVQNILFPAFRLLFGTLYPAYASYKAVRTKCVKEYVSICICIIFLIFRILNYERVKCEKYLTNVLLLSKQNIYKISTLPIKMFLI